MSHTRPLTAPASAPARSWTALGVPDDLGPRLRRLGGTVAVYGTALVFLGIGGLKFTALEAEAVRPLVETSPLMRWMYGIFSVQNLSNLLGVVEIATALCLMALPVSRRLGALGAAMATAALLITLSFLATSPAAWEAKLGGFPALSSEGGFLLKDLVLLGAALWALGVALTPRDETARAAGREL